MSGHREGLAAQEAAYDAAHDALADDLEALSACARRAARAHSSRKRRGRWPREPLDEVYAAVHRVRSSEEAAELAALDLATAGGADA